MLRLKLGMGYVESVLTDLILGMGIEKSYLNHDKMFSQDYNTSQYLKADPLSFRVIFKFKSSKKSNNGTDVNAGQIPQLLYRFV